MFLDKVASSLRILEERSLRDRMEQETENCDDCGRRFGEKDRRHFVVMFRPMVLLCGRCIDLRMDKRYKRP